MPIITIDKFPAVARSGRVSQYAPQMDELAELLKMKNFGEGNAVSFEVSKDDLNALVTSLRKEAKNHGRKIQTVYKDGTLFAKDNGKVDDEPASAAPIRAAVATGKAK